MRLLTQIGSVTQGNETRWWLLSGGAAAPQSFEGAQFDVPSFNCPSSGVPDVLVSVRLGFVNFNRIGSQ